MSIFTIGLIIAAIGVISVIVSFTVFGEKDYGFYIFLIGAMTILIGLLVTAVSPRQDSEEKSETVITRQPIDKKKPTTLEKCKKNEFCKVKKVEGNLICTSDGCWIDYNTLKEIEVW